MSRYASAVPRFQFSDDLQTQQLQLRDNPMLQRFAASRRKLADDPHRPVYHFTSPEHRLNDPNGLCRWQGRWHLFYQGYPPEDPRQHWGHAVSDDLIHWRDLPYAIYPDPERCCYSGMTYIEQDRAIAMYHGTGTEAGTMIATSQDPLLLNWNKLNNAPVIRQWKPDEPRLPYTVFDPCLWKQGGRYYALTGGRLNNGPAGKTLRAEFLHVSDDLIHWQYLHPFLEDDHYGLVGDDGACPYFLPIADRHILLHFSHMSGGKYLLGDYDTDRQKFVVTHGGDFNFGPFAPAGVHAPSAFPDGQGGIIAIFNMNVGKPCDGWDQLMTLPRRLTLVDRDRLGIEPAGDYALLRGEHGSMPPQTLPANEDVIPDGIHGRALEIIADVDAANVPALELDVLCSPDQQEFTRIIFYHDRGYPDRAYAEPPAGTTILPRSSISIDTSRSSILPDAMPRPTETAMVEMDDAETLKLHVFVDHSVVEVFVNGRQCVALRAYPGRRDSTGIRLRAIGREAKLLEFHAWQLKGIFM